VTDGKQNKLNRRHFHTDRLNLLKIRNDPKFETKMITKVLFTDFEKKRPTLSYVHIAKY